MLKYGFCSGDSCCLLARFLFIFLLRLNKTALFFSINKSFTISKTFSIFTLYILYTLCYRFCTLFSFLLSRVKRKEEISFFLRRDLLLFCLFFLQTRFLGVESSKNHSMPISVNLFCKNKSNNTKNEDENKVHCSLCVECE